MSKRKSFGHGYTGYIILGVFVLMVLPALLALFGALFPQDKPPQQTVNFVLKPAGGNNLMLTEETEEQASEQTAKDEAED